MAIITRWLGLPPEAIRPGAQRGRPPISSASSVRPSSRCCSPACAMPGKAMAMHDLLRLARPCAANRPIPARPSATAWASASPSPR
ncbi:hypothetical protein V6L77_26255 [Pannonibacter sp. Pt2-lr]